MPIDLPIYLDYNATTPVDPRVLEAMLPWFTDRFANAASTQHAPGRAAAEAVDVARRQVAALIAAPEESIVFTSGATEANNLAVQGVARGYAEKGRHIITAVNEHPAVIDPCRRLEREGFDVTWLRPDADGLIQPDIVEQALRDDTILVSIMWANNETGAINPVPRIGAVCKQRGVLVHSDATQFVGKRSVDVDAAQVDLLSATGHKFYGPKGTGFLFVRTRRPRVRLTPILEGGGHEHGMRSGTLNVPGIVGLGKACDVCMNDLEVEAPRLAALRDRLETEVTAQVDGVTVNSPRRARLDHVWHVSFSDVDPAGLLEAMPDLAVSAAAACHTGKPTPSHVLKAIGLSDELVLASVRFSLGRFTSDGQINHAIEHVARAIHSLRSNI